MSMRTCSHSRTMRSKVTCPKRKKPVLMKLLWVCRLARPDLAYAISSLATPVTRWSRNSDKQLYRLVSYLNSTKDLCLVSQVHDPPEKCTLDLFCDADLGGCPFTARSTSGLFLVDRGENGTFAPIAWRSRRQTHVARSTADAELNALSEGLHEELLPTYQLFELLLGNKTPKPVAREDNSAVVQSIRQGYSVKLRHLARTPKLSLASLHEEFTTWCKLVQTPTAEQLGVTSQKHVPWLGKRGRRPAFEAALAKERSLVTSSFAALRGSRHDLLRWLSGFWYGLCLWSHLVTLQ